MVSEAHGSSSEVSDLGRRDLLKVAAAGVAGVTALALPGAPAAASGVAGVESGPTTTLLPVTAELLFHFDAGNAASYGGSGTTWSDVAGGGNSGTLTSGVSFVAPSGGQPAHFTFNGTDSAVNVATAAGSQLLTGPNPTAYTKMIWFRRDTENRFDNLFSAQSGSGQAQHFLFFGGSTTTPYKMVTAGNGSSYNRIFATLAVGAGVWTFAAVTFSTTSGFTVYVNQNDRTWTGAEHLATSPYNSSTDALGGALGFQIGGYGGLHRFDGSIATAIAYSTALTEQQVKGYYAGTVDRFHPAG